MNANESFLNFSFSKNLLHTKFLVVYLLICSPLFSCFTGRLVTGLVREFLEYFELDFTIAVFDPETNFVSRTGCGIPLS